MAKEKIPKLSLKMKLCWPTAQISTSVAGVLAGYISFYASDFMGIDVALAGVLIMVSKVFDALADIAAGYAVDRTRTRFGRGRPYEFAILGYWVCLIAFFCTPKMSPLLSAAYLFLMYTLINAVFGTLMGVASPVYMANALDDPRQSVSLIALSSTLATLFTMVASIIIPQMIASMGDTSEGWARIALTFGIPMIVLGMIRFFVIKEKRNQGTSDMITFKEMVPLLAKNKYILLVALTNCISSIGCNMNINVNTYYCKYIMNDVGLASLLSLSMLAVIFIVILMPGLSKRFGTVKVMRACALIGAAGYMLRLFDLSNVPLLLISSIVSMVGFYTFFSFSGAMVIDCMDYGEWKNGKRAAGSVAATQNILSQIGAAVGIGLCGMLMGIVGYDGMQNVQPVAANNMIIALSSWVPALFCVIEYFMLRAYNLEDMLPQIRKELEARHEVK